MKYRDIVNQANREVLYHSLTQDKMAYIIEHNTMDARWDSIINGVKYKGNSVSRNNAFWFHDGKGFRITLNARTLRQTNRILPVEADEILHKTYGRFGRPTPDHARRHDDKMREEFVVGSIKDLSRHILHIAIRLPTYTVSLYDCIRQTIEWCGSNHIPISMTSKAVKYVRDFEDMWAEDYDEDQPSILDGVKLTENIADMGCAFYN